jgi:ParB family chromosome partitioning protein
MKRRALGRGLDALLGGGTAPPPEQGLHELPVHVIERGRYQPRLDIDPEALEALAASIRTHGVMQPIVVRPLPDGRHELIAGERRWRAAQLAGLATIPAIVRDVTDDAALALALIENIQREGLTPLEEATALKRLQDEFAMTQQQVADAVGKSRAAVTNLMRLLTLETPVRRLLESRRIDMGHARALLGLTGAAQVQAAEQVAARGLSVRDTERLVQRASRPPRAVPAGNADVRALEDRLAARLGTRVSIASGRRGSGRVVIAFRNLDEFDALLHALGVAP